MNRIIPTIFACNKKEFDERFKKLVPISKNLQIDFMDGKFVKAKSSALSQVPNLKKYRNNFEAHLMVFKSEKWIKKLKQKGFKKIIFHIESAKEPEKLIEKTNSLKLSAYLAINPETPIKKIIPFLSNVEGVLFIGVHPGKEHQKFIPNVYKKINQLRKINRKIKIQVDGGVNFQNIKKLASLKVNYVNSGSLISEAGNPKQVFKKLNSIFKMSRSN